MTEFCKLPPLILHPFSDGVATARLAEASEASLILHGLADRDHRSDEHLMRKLLEGRYCEILMLFYIGKDLIRWATQCVEFAEHQPNLAESGLNAGTFIDVLIEDAPEAVRRKLEGWGVFDYKNIFRRAFGLHAVFEARPEKEILSTDFLRNYHRFADHLFEAYREIHPPVRVNSMELDFELYASGEYSKLLEEEWGPV